MRISSTDISHYVLVVQTVIIVRVVRFSSSAYSRFEHYYFSALSTDDHLMGFKSSHLETPPSFLKLTPSLFQALGFWMATIVEMPAQLRCGQQAL